MSVVYTLICKGSDKVLCEFTEYQGNFEQISRSLLRKVEKNKRATFSYADEFYFHYINANNITYMCMCDNKLSQDTAFAYLEEIKTLFTDTFSPKEIDSAMAYTLNDSFRDSIRGKMNYFNANLNESDKLAKLKKGVIEYKDNMLQASDVLSERGEKINLIVKKADSLRGESINYLNKVNNSIVNLYMKIFKLFCIGEKSSFSSQMEKY